LRSRGFQVPLVDRMACTSLSLTGFLRGDEMVLASPTGPVRCAEVSRRRAKRRESRPIFRVSERPGDPRPDRLATVGPTFEPHRTRGSLATRLRSPLRERAGRRGPGLTRGPEPKAGLLPTSGSPPASGRLIANPPKPLAGRSHPHSGDSSAGRFPSTPKYKMSRLGGTGATTSRIWRLGAAKLPRALSRRFPGRRRVDRTALGRPLKCLENRV